MPSSRKPRRNSSVLHPPLPAPERKEE
jgi:hypothetical protein